AVGLFVGSPQDRNDGPAKELLAIREETNTGADAEVLEGFGTVAAFEVVRGGNLQAGGQVFLGPVYDGADSFAGCWAQGVTHQLLEAGFVLLGVVPGRSPREDFVGHAMDHQAKQSFEVVPELASVMAMV